MKRIVIFLLLLVTIISVTACAAEEAAITTEFLQNTEATFYRSEDDTFAIETPYCVLNYPMRWMDMTVIERSEVENLYIVAFVVKLDDVQLPLFSIEIGEGSDGYELGTIETVAGLKTVYMNDLGGMADETLSEDDEALCMEMFEDLNVIISGLVYNCGMQLPR